MQITIDPTNPASIRAAAAKVRQYSESFKEKRLAYLTRVAQEGTNVAQERFNEYAEKYDCAPVTVTVVVNGHGASIVASGKEVGFIEFGTGVTHPEHSGTVFADAPQHGTYGKGRGKRKGWYYYAGVNGETIYTTGRDPAEAMTAATERMIQVAPAIAREVFGNG